MIVENTGHPGKAAGASWMYPQCGHYIRSIEETHGAILQMDGGNRAGNNIYRTEESASQLTCSGILQSRD